MRRAILLVAVLVWATAATAQGPDAEALRNRLIFVQDRAGRETAGRFLGLTDGELRVLVDGVVETIPQQTILRIERPGDSVIDGILIGAAVGFGVAVVQAVARPCCFRTYLHYAWGLVPIGAGVGAKVDYARPGRTTVYTASVSW